MKKRRKQKPSNQGQSESWEEGEEKRNGRLVGVSETKGELAEWRKFQLKT